MLHSEVVRVEADGRTYENDCWKTQVLSQAGNILYHAEKFRDRILFPWTEDIVPLECFVLPFACFHGQRG